MSEQRCHTKHESAFPLPAGHTLVKRWKPGEGEYTVSEAISTTGLTKRELFAVFSTQPGVAEIVAAAGYRCPDNFTVWKDAQTKIGTFNDWWSELSNAERFALTAKVRVEQADALIAALTDEEISNAS